MAPLVLSDPIELDGAFGSIKYEWKPCLSSVNPMMMPEDLENITEVRIRKPSVQHPSAIQS